MEDEASYDCPYCGEEIIIPFDVSQGRNQEYIEDCPVCCSPVIIRVQIERNGQIHVQAQQEF